MHESLSNGKNVIKAITEKKKKKRKPTIYEQACVDGIMCFGCHTEQNKLRWLISKQLRLWIHYECTYGNTDALCRKQICRWLMLKWCKQVTVQRWDARQLWKLRYTSEWTTWHWSLNAIGEKAAIQYKLWLCKYPALKRAPLQSLIVQVKQTQSQIQGAAVLAVKNGTPMPHRSGHLGHRYTEGRWKKH